MSEVKIPNHLNPAFDVYDRYKYAQEALSALHADLQAKTNQLAALQQQVHDEALLLNHANEVAAKLEADLAASHAEVLLLKSANEDAKLEYQTLANERDELRKRLYEQGKVLAEGTLA